jgi:predicted double-glycine peptidase
MHFMGCTGPRTTIVGSQTTDKPQRHTLKQLRDMYVVKQQLDYSCGSAALATLLQYYFGDKKSEKEILDKLFVPLNEKQKKIKSRKGFSLLDLRTVARTMGYEAAGFKLPFQQLSRLSAPVIVHLEVEGYKHFAVLRGMSWRRVYLADPARGNLRMSLERFQGEWTGVIFVLGRKNEEKIKEYPLAIHHNADYGQPELVHFSAQMDRGMFISMLPLR